MMDINTGKALDKNESIASSLNLMMQTLVGSRVINRGFGCGIEQYIDQPISLVQMDIGAAILAAIEKFEPRVKVTQIDFEEDETSSAKLKVNVYVEDHIISINI